VNGYVFERVERILRILRIRFVNTESGMPGKSIEQPDAAMTSRR